MSGSVRCRAHKSKSRRGSVWDLHIDVRNRIDGRPVQVARQKHTGRKSAVRNDTIVCANGLEPLGANR